MPAKAPIVFIHGLWLHAESWNNWIQFFKEKGREASAVSWPGDLASAAETRQHPESVAGYGVHQIVEHIAKQIRGITPRPVGIGHSFGGLLLQSLLGQDLLAGGIAIDPAPVQGVWQLPFAALRSSFPALGNPLNYSRSVALSESEFRFGFGNALPEQESKELYAKYAIPGPAKPIFQAASATFNPGSETKVNVDNAKRGPLLITGALKDHTVPALLSKSAHHLYHKSPAVTEYHEFADKGHSLTIDSGWRDVAQVCLAWLDSKGL